MASIAMSGEDRNLGFQQRERERGEESMERICRYIEMYGRVIINPENYQKK